MLTFVQSLEHYMVYEVIEPNWNQMIDKIDGTCSQDITKVEQVGQNFFSKSLPHYSGAICLSTPFLQWNHTFLDCCSSEVKTFSLFAQNLFSIRLIVD